MKCVLKIIAVLSLSFSVCACKGNPNDNYLSDDVRQTSENITAEIDSDVIVSDADKIEFYGETAFDKSALGSFVYDSVVENMKIRSEYNGLNILSAENAEIYDLYLRSLALREIVFSHGEEFPVENFGEDFLSFDSLPQILVNDSCYCCSMVTYDSFYNALTEVFTKEAVDKMLEMENRSLYEYNGALWITVGTKYIDTKTIHEDYSIEKKTDSAFDIAITAYLVEDARDEEFEYANADAYKKQIFHYTILKTENGWRVNDFPVYRFYDGDMRRIQIADLYAI